MGVKLNLLAGASALRYRDPVDSTTPHVDFAEPEQVHVDAAQWMVDVIDCDPACLPSEFCYKSLTDPAAAPECHPKLEQGIECGHYDGFYLPFVCGTGLACDHPPPSNVTTNETTSYLPSTDMNHTYENGTFPEEGEEGGNNATTKTNQTMQDTMNVTLVGTTGKSFLQRRSPNDTVPLVGDMHALRCTPCGGWNQPACPHVEMVAGWVPDWMPVPSGLRRSLSTHPAPVMRVNPQAEICVELAAHDVICPNATQHVDHSPLVTECVQVSTVAPHLVGAPLQGHEFLALEDEVEWMAHEYAMYAAGEHSCGHQPASNIPVPHPSLQSLHNDSHFEDIQHAMEDGEWYSSDMMGQDAGDYLPYGDDGQLHNGTNGTGAGVMDGEHSGETPAPKAVAPKAKAVAVPKTAPKQKAIAKATASPKASANTGGHDNSTGGHANTTGGDVPNVYENATLPMPNPPHPLPEGVGEGFDE